MEWRRALMLMRTGLWPFVSSPNGLFPSFPCHSAYFLTSPSLNDTLFTYTQISKMHPPPPPNSSRHHILWLLFFMLFHSVCHPAVCVSEWVNYLQSVFGQCLGSFHDDLLNSLNRQVTSSLLQTLAEEANHLKVTQVEMANRKCAINTLGST